MVPGRRGTLISTASNLAGEFVVEAGVSGGVRGLLARRGMGAMRFSMLVAFGIVGVGGMGSFIDSEGLRGRERLRLRLRLRKGLREGVAGRERSVGVLGLEGVSWPRRAATMELSVSLIGGFGACSAVVVSARGSDGILFSSTSSEAGTDVGAAGRLFCFWLFRLSRDFAGISRGGGLASVLSSMPESRSWYICSVLNGGLVSIGGSWGVRTSGEDEWIWTGRSTSGVESCLSEFLSDGVDALKLFVDPV